MIPGYIRQDAIFYVIGVFILLVCLKIYSESEVFTLKCIGFSGNFVPWMYTSRCIKLCTHEM